jgi:hypothetical protein
LEINGNGKLLAILTRLHEQNAIPCQPAGGLYERGESEECETQFETIDTGVAGS